MGDQIQNFIKNTVDGGHDDGDTTISVVDASEFPDPGDGEYNVTWYDSTNYPDPADDPNKELVRVTARDTGANTITVERAQEGTSATNKNTSGATYKMLLAPTKKVMDEKIEADSEDTLKNKTINGDDNDISNLAHGEEVDNPSSGVHGVTGDLVGTDDEQELEHKTLNNTNNTVVPSHPYKARAYLSSTNQTIPESLSPTKVELNGVSYDPNSDFDNSSNYRYTAPVDGTYSIKAIIRYLSVPDGTEMELEIQINGSTKGKAVSSAGSNSNPSVGIAGDLELSADDYVELFTKHDNGSSLDINAAEEQTYITVHLLSI